MAKDSGNRKGKTAGKAAQGGVMTARDNVRLMAGFVLIVMGAFLACSILSYIFYWKIDMSALMETNPRVDVVYSNICGPSGARVAHALVGGCFGLFAFAIPMFLTILGWRLFRFKSLRLHRLTLISALILIHLKEHICERAALADRHDVYLVVA